MLKVELPKNGVIERAARRPLEGGLMNGALGLDITFQAPGSGASFGPQFGEILVKLLAVDLPKNLPLVRLHGVDLGHWSAAVMKPFIAALEQYGRTVQVVLDSGTEWPEWLDPQSRLWIIVRTREPLVVVPCREVWYAPLEAPFEDVILPPGLPGATYMYLAAAGVRLGEDELVDFLLKSPHSWCVA